MDSNALPGLGLGSDPTAVVTVPAGAQVASILRREIQRGDHPPDTRLRQRDVAARLGVSTTPVREAFQALHAEGFLIVENHRGAVVVRPSVADIEEGYAIRTALETLAVRAAAERFVAADLEPLRELLDRMQRASAQDKWTALDQEFHHRLNAMAAMPKLLALIDSLRGGIAFYIESAFDDDVERHQADLDHVAILEACAAHDVGTAERLVVDHLEHTGAAVLRSFGATRA